MEMTVKKRKARRGLTDVVHVRVTPAEKKRLDNFISAEDTTISDLIRSFINSLPEKLPAQSCRFEVTLLRSEAEEAVGSPLQRRVGEALPEE